MSEKVETVKIKVTRFKTTDGKLFETAEKAYNHQNKIDEKEKIKKGELNGTIKGCTKCNRTGKITKSKIVKTPTNYPTNLPDSEWVGQYKDVTEHYEVDCPKCNGKGYLEKKVKTVWE